MENGSQYSYTNPEPEGFLEKAYRFFKTPTSSRTAGVAIFTLFLLAGLPAYLYIVGQQTNTQQQAAGPAQRDCYAQVYRHGVAGATQNPYSEPFRVKANERFDITFNLKNVPNNVNESQFINENERAVINWGPESPYNLVGHAQFGAYKNANGVDNAVWTSRYGLNQSNAGTERGFDAQDLVEARDIYFPESMAGKDYEFVFGIADAFRLTNEPNLPGKTHPEINPAVGPLNSHCVNDDKDGSNDGWIRFRVHVDPSDGSVGPTPVAGVPFVTIDPSDPVACSLYVFGAPTDAAKPESAPLLAFSNSGTTNVAVQAGQPLAVIFNTSLEDRVNKNNELVQEVKVNFGAVTIPGFLQNTYTNKRFTNATSFVIDAKRNGTFPAKNGQFRFEPLIYSGQGGTINAGVTYNGIQLCSGASTPKIAITTSGVAPTPITHNATTCYLNTEFEATVGKPYEVYIDFGRVTAPGEKIVITWGDSSGATIADVPTGSRTYRTSHTYTQADTNGVVITGQLVLNDTNPGGNSLCGLSSSVLDTQKRVRVNPAPLPTATPTPTATATPIPPPGATATPTLPPGTTATPTGTPPVTGNTSILVKLELQGTGIGTQGQAPKNSDPKHKTRDITVELFDSANKLVLTKTVPGALGYNTFTGLWDANVDLGNITSGVYSVKVKTPMYLRRLIGKKSNKTTVLLKPGVNDFTTNVETLVAGDADNDNLLTVKDFHLYHPCFDKPITTSNCALVDFNDDGLMDNKTSNILLDYNLILKAFSVQEGD